MKREEAIKLIDTHTVCFYNEIDSPTLQALHLAIEALSADAVAVVRCKDCIHGSHKTVIGGDNIKWCEIVEHNVEDEDYCSWGERREPTELPQYEEWQDEFNKMCESARPKTFVADEWYRDTFKGEEE